LFGSLRSFSHYLSFERAEISTRGSSLCGGNDSESAMAAQLVPAAEIH
jgi:hypothetical protein